MSIAQQVPEEKISEIVIPEELPILVSKESVLYPSLITPLAANEERTIKLIDDAVSAEKIIGVFSQRRGVEEQPPANLHTVGTAAIIVKMLKMSDGSIRALLQGIQRCRLLEVTQVDPYVKGKIEVIKEEKLEKTPKLEALV
jgi:ATP-dependent Lon protease